MINAKLEFNIYDKSYISIYRILLRIKKGLYSDEIARQIRMKKGSVSRFIKKLEEFNYISRVLRSNCVIYEVTPKGHAWMNDYKMARSGKNTNSSLSMKEKNTRLHNLAVKFPILKDNKEAKFDKKVEINNWTKQYSTLSYPMGMTLEKTTKSVIVYFHQFQTTQEMFLSDFYNWVFKGTYYVYYYLMKQGITIDIFSGEIIREHIANESPELNDRIPKNKTVEVGLDRKARAIFPANFMAKAWLDRSMGDVDIETNDMIYQEKLLLMPENIHSMRQDLENLGPTLQALTQQINLHLQVQEDTRKVLAEMSKTLKVMRKGGKK